MEIYSNWQQVPSAWKNTKRISKLNFTNSPYDKNLITLLNPFNGDDDLRPVMSGINFDEKGICVTNAHVLAFLPYPNEKFNGTYATTKQAEKMIKKLSYGTEVKDDLYSSKFPNYWAVIPRFDLQNMSFFSKISAYKLLQYCQVAKQVNNEQVSFAYRTEFQDELIRLDLNPNFVETAVKFFLQQGIEEIFVSSTGRGQAVVFSNELEYSDKSIIGLLMPIKDNQQPFFGATNTDLKIELKCYFNFYTNEIYNEDGSIADFKISYENNTELSVNELNLLNKLTSNNSLQILNNILVDEGTIFASNFDQSIYIKNSTQQRGIYTYKSNALTKSPDDLEKLIQARKDVEQQVIKEFIPIAELQIQKDAFLYYLNILKDFVGNDDLRPIMTGVLLTIDYETNNVYLVATNANILAKFNVSEYCKIISNSKKNPNAKNDFEKMALQGSGLDTKIILSINLLADFIKTSDDIVNLKFNSSTTIYETQNLKFVSKNIDGIYPNYKAVINSNFETVIKLNAKEIISCFKNDEVKKFIKEMKAKKQNKKSWYFFKLIVLESNLNSIKLEFWESDNNSPIGEIELCQSKIKIDKKPIEKSFESLLLIMPVLAEIDALFAFNMDLFEDVISNYNHEEVEMYSAAPNKAFLIDASTIDFNKTVNYKKGLQVEKEHKETLEQVAKGKIDVKAGIEKTVEDHLKEDPNYYDKLEKIENNVFDASKLDLDNSISSREYEKGVDAKIKELLKAPYKTRFEFKKDGNKWIYKNTVYDVKDENLLLELKDVLTMMNRSQVDFLRIEKRLPFIVQKYGSDVNFAKKMYQEAKDFYQSKLWQEKAMRADEILFDYLLSRLKELKKPKKEYVIESPGFNTKETRKKKKQQIEKELKIIELEEAIEALKLTLEFTETQKDKAELQEAIEALEITLEFL